MLSAGLEFQDFCAVQFAKLGVPITNFSSRKYQLEKGENMQGYEFKLDMNFRKTGNLWIETKERSDLNKEYVDSGIYRNDNTIFYIIGDYEGCYLIQKNVLKALTNKYDKRENNMKTSIGFLLPTKAADTLFNYIKFDG